MLRLTLLVLLCLRGALSFPTIDCGCGDDLDNINNAIIEAATLSQIVSDVLMSYGSLEAGVLPRGQASDGSSDGSLLSPSKRLILEDLASRVFGLDIKSSSATKRGLDPIETLKCIVSLSHILLFICSSILMWDSNSYLRQYVRFDRIDRCCSNLLRPKLA